MKCNFISRRMSFDILPMARLYFESIDSPVSLSCYLLLKYKEYEQYIEKSIDPLEYNSPESFHKDYLAVKFLSKYDSFDVSIDKDEVAMLAFRKAEMQCAEANNRINSGSLPGAVGSVIHRAGEKLSKLLPMFDPELLQEIVNSSRFGPGVTSSCKGDYTGIFNKFSSENHITPECKSMLVKLATFIDIPPHFLQFGEEVQGNRVTTVPKNSKTNRTIAVEPHVNAYFQRGVGLYFREVLRNGYKIDLRSQKRNQELALKASLDGDFVTVDLAAASDTISIEVVRMLLPDHWVYFLESLRSSRYLRDGQWYKYQKHSSMGNGYTFELESLIFSSIVHAVYSYLGIKDKFRVYGDDIIVKVEAYGLLSECLSYLGFSINESKTHYSGYFRESCGMDAFHGVNVTPFFFKKGNDVVQIITFANWLASTKLPFCTRHLWKFLYFAVPKAWANKGPKDGEGIHFYVDPFTIPESVIPYNHYGYWVYRYTSVVFRPSKRSVPDEISSKTASLKLLDMIQPSGETANLRSLAQVVVDDESLYARQSVGRRRGKWCRKSVVLWGDWPVVE